MIKQEKHKNIIKSNYRYKKYNKDTKEYVGVVMEFHKKMDSNFILNEKNIKGEYIDYVFEKYPFKPYFLYKLYWKFTIWYNSPFKRKLKTLYQLTLYERISTFFIILTVSFSFLQFLNNYNLSGNFEKLDKLRIIDSLNIEKISKNLINQKLKVESLKHQVDSLVFTIHKSYKLEYPQPRLNKK